MNSGYIICLLLLSNLVAFSQNQQVAPKYACTALKNRGDCDKALQIKTKQKIQFECTPEGFGKELEIQDNSSKSKYSFEKEHNTLWMKFEASSSALLVFDLVPNNRTYDYDFLLFRDNGEGFCKSINQKKALPIRSNISRNDTKKRGITGLSANAEEPFRRSGPGSNFSEGLEVKKGDVFYLVVDNVHGGTEGFSLEFKYYKFKEIKGQITDRETGAGIEAKITWEDAATGKLLKETVSDASTGKYKMNVPFDVEKKKSRFILSAFGKNHFFSEKSISSDQLLGKYSHTLAISLPKLKKGEKIQLQSINFYGNSPKTLPSALPAMGRLHLLMEMHPKLKIQIEGHTNGCGSGVPQTQILSENRAMTVKLYLMNKDIEEDRMGTQGFNCTQMLFPSMNNPWEMMMNRRVEILIVKGIFGKK